MHKFDVSKKHKLDSELRRKILPPFETLLRLGLKERDIVADIGCGIGYFTLPASDAVGAAGKVYALDISSEMLEEVESKVKEKDVSNVYCVKTDELSLKLDNGSVTFAFMCNVLHEINDKDEFINEIKRIMKDKSRIAIIEWEKMKSEFGPPIDHRLDKSEVENILTENNFKNVYNISIGDNFYAVIGEKYD